MSRDKYCRITYKHPVCKTVYYANVPVRRIVEGRYVYNQHWTAEILTCEDIPDDVIDAEDDYYKTYGSRAEG